MNSSFSFKGEKLAVTTRTHTLHTTRTEEKEKKNNEEREKEREKHIFHSAEYCTFPFVYSPAQISARIDRAQFYGFAE